MADLADGESTQMKGSGASPYTLRNVGGVYSCSCPAWRNQGVAIERRTCKHLKKLRGDAAELARVGAPAPPPKKAPAAGGAEEEGDEAKGPPLLLAHAWAGDVDLAGWWMSEKLDGVRAYWDGKQFLSRLGNPYHAPDWFVVGLPSEPLDGELWGGRKKFQRTVSIARRQDKSDHWKELTYVVFDAPAMDAPFEERLAFCEERLRTRAPAHAKHHPHEPCRGVDHLRAELARVEALGGEGLMLRQPRSKYEVGRSSTLLKVKSFHDAEARVVAHTAGEGRHKGRVGALVVEMANGTRFSVGTGLSDEDRRSPPPVGQLVTYRYQELSEGGVPRFPSYVGPAIDKKLLKRSGLLALVFYAAHAIEIGLRMPLENELWSCNVAALLVALGLLAGSAPANAAGGLLLLVGEPVWIYDLFRGGSFLPTTLLTHVGVAVLALLGMRRLGVPRRAWPVAVAVLAAATVAAAVTSSAADNVNVAVVTPPGFEGFGSHGGYMAWLGTTLCLGMLGLMLVLRRVWRASPSRAPGL